MAGVTDGCAPRRRVKAEPAPTTPHPRQEALIGEQIALAHDDLRPRRWQIVGERAGVALKVLTALAGLAVAGAAPLMIWTASRAEGLVVAAFSVPPDLAPISDTR